MTVKKVVSNLVSKGLASIAWYDSQTDRLEQHPYPHYPHYEVVLEMFTYGDYVGSTFDAANTRFISEKYKELFDNEGIITKHYSHYTQSILIFASRPSVVRSGLFDDLKELMDHPVFDDEYLSDYEMELAIDAWDEYAKKNFIQQLEKEGCDTTNQDCMLEYFLDTVYSGKVQVEYHATYIYTGDMDISDFKEECYE